MRKCKLTDCEEPHVARGFCKRHYRRARKYGDDPALWPPTGKEFQAGVPEGRKRCRRCLQVKPLDAYSPSARGVFGRFSYCKACQSEYVNGKWHERDEEARARDRLRMALGDARRKYGEEGVAVALRREAGEGCDVCGRRGDRMAIDHCHTTGKVRGLLCMGCNVALGAVEDDPDRLRALALYVERAND